MSALPSGEQIRLVNGDQEAVVVAVGGGIRTYRVGGVDVIDGYAEDAMCDGARGQNLVPFPNRLEAGAWTWNGTVRRFALTEPSQGNAIHGLARWLSWTATERSESAVTMTVRINPQPGWEWPLDVSVRVALGTAGLSVDTAIVNRGISAAPVAAGAHPYLTVGTALIDQCRLTIPARQRIETGPGQIPVGVEPVEGSPFDFREPRVIAGLAIDFAFADLIRDADRRARVRLEAPDGRWVAMWVDEHYPWLEVFTGDSLPDAGRRRQGLGVEPMSAPPNALATGEGLAVLDPDDTWTGSWGIETSLLGQQS